MSLLQRTGVYQKTDHWHPAPRPSGVMTSDVSEVTETDADVLILNVPEDVLERRRILRLRQLHVEKILLLPLIAATIAGVICLVGALNRIPAREPPSAAEDHAAPPVSADHQPLRGHG